MAASKKSTKKGNETAALVVISASIIILSGFGLNLQSNIERLAVAAVQVFLAVGMGYYAGKNIK